ncbi:MAG TPA: flagellar motor protein MotB [Solirubrobacteraceae bacterium]|nr:flagellar motor protein MotB [Solirubrobacteraceae bacterium]
MSAARAAGRRRRRGGHEEEPENEERWLLTYADMLTLMFALFMVLFSISAVNISKFKTLQESLKSAFSGSILSGGRAIMQSGSESTSKHTPATSPVPAIIPVTPNVPQLRDTNAQQIGNAMVSASGTAAEQRSFEALKRRMDAYARSHGFAQSVVTNITRQGLVVRVLTDNLLFASGSATLQSRGDPLLNEVAHLLDIDRRNPITVEGFTDNVPIHTAQFPTNWQLSTARAVNVLLYLTAHGVARGRLGAAGYADLHPIASNATATGRARNRRVDIVLDRDYPAPS